MGFPPCHLIAGHEQANSHEQASSRLNVYVRRARVVEQAKNRLIRAPHGCGFSPRLDAGFPALTPARVQVLGASNIGSGSHQTPPKTDVRSGARRGTQRLAADAGKPQPYAP